jgi:hypothetical protein
MRTRLLLSAVVAVLATWAFSLGASAAAPAGDGPSASARIFTPLGTPMRATAGAAAVDAAANSAANLSYHGGAVMTSPTVFLIFWGPTWQSGFSSGGFTSAQARTYISSFFGGVGGSAWLNSTTQYCQGVATGTQFCPAGAAHPVNRTGQLGGTWVDTTAIPTHPTDAQVQAAARRGAGHFGFHASALYMVLTSHSHSIRGFGTSFCAYHDNTSFNGQPLAYANEPYAPDAGASCGENFVNRSNDSFGNGFFDGYSITAGHEYAEAVSDMLPSQRLAWVDSHGAENGDKCAWGRGPGPDSASQNISLGGHSFAVQSLWSNLANGGAGGCVIR